MWTAILATTLVGTWAWTQRVSQCSQLSCSILPCISIFITLLFFKAIYSIILYPYYLSPLRHLPQVKQGPLYSRLLGEPSDRTLGKWVNQVPNNGLIRYYGLLNSERVLVTRPQGCKEVLQTHAYNFLKFPWALEIMGQIAPLGVLVAPPIKHKVDRKILQPAFKFKYVKNLYPVFWSESAKFLDVIERSMKESGNNIVDVGKRLHNVTLDIITLTSFGGSLNAAENPDSQRIQEYRNLFSMKTHHLHYRFMAFILPSWLYRRVPIKAQKEITGAVKAVRKLMLPLIQQRRQRAQLTEKGDINPSGEEEGDIIATMLRSGGKFTDEYLLDQATNFMVAGQETTATAVTFTLYLLSEHPDIQTRLRQEVRAVLPSPSLNTPVDATLIESIPYLTAVCNEALRVYSPVPDTRRIVTSPNTIVENTPIPVGTVVTVAPWVIHRSHEVWGKDADQFDPNRWFVDKSDPVQIDPLGGSGDPYAVMPFTYGARSCIGERFARSEMLTLVAQLVGRYDWKFKGIGSKGNKPMKIAFGVVAGPFGGCMTMYADKIGGW